MAGIRYIDLITDAEEITQVRSIRAVVRRLANDIQSLICGVAEWPFLWTSDFFQSVAPYETGTVTATNGSPTITGVLTVFTSAMVGRKIRINNESGYYTIKSFTSTLVITLDENYTGTTTAGLSYSIYKDEYLLRGDLDAQKRIRNSENGYALFSMSATEFDSQYPVPIGSGAPALDVYLGSAVKTYTTGTVSASSGSRTLTGSGTSWTTAEGLSRGTKLKIGTLLFTVNTVDSDTAITMYEITTAAITALTTYTAILDNVIVELHSIPDSVLTFYYRFQRVPAVMDADNDLPELPHPMQPLIRLGMLPTLWRQKGMTDKAVSDEATFAKELATWIAKYNLPVLDRTYPLYPFTIRRRLLEARWPAGTGMPLYR